MEQYIRDKYERKLFMNPNQRNSMGPMTLTSKRNSFEAENSSKTSTAFAFSRQLQQLKEMGFQNHTKCMEALKSTNGDMQSAIDKLTANNSYSDFGDLLGSNFKELNIVEKEPAKEKPTNLPIKQSDGWSDFELSGSNLLDEPSPKLPAPTTEAAYQSVPLDPWTSPSMSTNVSHALGSSKLNFTTDEDDPFKDLMHNPFK